MDAKDIMTQSKSAYGQWAVQWRKHAEIHSKFKMKSLLDFEHVGLGRAVLCIANGFSFEENLETIKELQKSVDIMVCDKTLGSCLDHGITPTYVMVCDANVNYEKYLEPWKDKLQNSILFINACGNPEWSHNGNWRDQYFFVNKDILNSEKEFMEISGCPNAIPAGTNVSNAMVILLTQSDNSGRRNFFGYDKVLLIGFDYSWRPDGKYYAFDEMGGGKTNYMRHIYAINGSGKPCYSSGNLAFSAQWLQKYITTFNLPVVQCSKEGILDLPAKADLKSQMTYSFRKEDAVKVKKSVVELRRISKLRKEIEHILATVGREHHLSHLATL